ncbi:MAG: hypothetical protein R3E10_13955 [Gemmatimonadota bacterium]
MRKQASLVTVALWLVPTALLGQRPQTLMNGPIHSGGFGGPVVRFSDLDGDLGILVGGRGGWIINHTFVIGGGGYGLANPDNFERLDSRGNTVELTMGYGGLELEYIPAWYRVVHPSFQVLVGAGGATWDDRFRGGAQYDDDAFFVVEPGANLMVNVAEVFRLGFGVSYRLTGDVELEGLDAGALDGASGYLTFKFGRF